MRFRTRRDIDIKMGWGERDRELNLLRKLPSTVNDIAVIQDVQFSLPENFCNRRIRSLFMLLGIDTINAWLDQKRHRKIEVIFHRVIKCPNCCNPDSSSAGQIHPSSCLKSTFKSSLHTKIPVYRVIVYPSLFPFVIPKDTVKKLLRDSCKMTA